MLTKELTGRIAERTGMTKKEVEHLLSTTNAIIRETLTDGKGVQLQGLGTLDIKEKKDRMFVLPRTGERVTVAGKRQLSFKPVVSLKNALKKR